MAAAQAGDERAFRALVEPYRRALDVHCYRMLGSPHDAEDVVQETLLRAWRSLDRFERRASVQTWLYRIATNACLDELERRPRRPEPMVLPYPDARLAADASPVADPAARYAQREGMELAFLTAIQRLPGRQRAVLILRDVLGWTGAEVAELLESTVAAVNSALQRARATVEHALPARSVAPGRSTQRDLLRRYVDAWERADIDGLVALLHEDAVLSMPPEPAIVGAAAIGSVLRPRLRRDGASCRREPGPTAGPRSCSASGGRTGATRPYRLLVLDVVGDRIGALRAHADPALLAAFDVLALVAGDVERHGADAARVDRRGVDDLERPGPVDGRARQRVERVRGRQSPVNGAFAARPTTNGAAPRRRTRSGTGCFRPRRRGRISVDGRAVRARRASRPGRRRRCDRDRPSSRPASSCTACRRSRTSASTRSRRP